LLNSRAELKGPAVPFIVRPISRAIAGKVEDTFLAKNFKASFDFLENQLATSPESGQFLCGPKLTGADIIMIFPLQGAKGRAGLTEEKYPLLWAYIKRLEERPAYQRAVQRAAEASGEKFSVL
jgi:glutathione S-transferase